MKKYLAVFVAPIEAYDKMKAEAKKKSPEERQKEMEEWKVWMENHKDDIADPGAPVGSARRVDESGTVTNVRNTIGGYMIIKAESAEAAAEVFKDAPHFGVAGGGVEVMEMMTM